MNMRVECHAGYCGEETPRCIWLGKRQIEVREVLDCWLTPGCRYFKILGDDNSIYILRHDEGSWDWDMTFYKQAEPTICCDRE